MFQGPHFVTALPIALMTCVRFVEQTGIGQMLLWIIALIFHILRDTGDMSQETFYWVLTSIIVLMAVIHWKNIMIVSCLPIALLMGMLYVIGKKCCGVSVQDSTHSITKLYNEIMTQDLEPMVLPFDEEYLEEDWSERL